MLPILAQGHQIAKPLIVEAHSFSFSLTIFGSMWFVFGLLMEMVDVTFTTKSNGDD